MAVKKHTVQILLNAKDEASKVFDKVGGAMVGFATGAAAIGGAAIVGIGAAAFTMANDVDSATAQLAGALAISKEEAAEYEDVMKGVFANNFGEGFDDIADSIATVNKNIGDLPDKELQKVTERALGFRDAFDKDVSESTAAARVLMDKFGITSDEAFDLMAKGLSEGLDASGDFLDSITEYSNLFAEGGGSADEFFSLLQTGLQGGVLGTDKAADLFKEFGIRITEASDTGAEALEALGIDSSVMFDGISDGSVSSVDAFQQVINAISEIEDPIERNRLGVELFGTQWEDMGASAVTAIDITNTKMEDMAGAADMVNAQYQTLGSGMEGLKRQALVALEPIGAILLDGINQAMPGVQMAVDWFTNTGAPAIAEFAQASFDWLSMLFTEAGPIVDEFADKFNSTLGPAMLLIEDAWDRISEALGIAREDFTVMDGILVLFNATLDAVVIGLQAVAVVAQGVAWAIEQISAALQIGKDLWGQYNQIIDQTGLSNIPLLPGSNASDAILGGIGDFLGIGGGGEQQQNQPVSFTQGTPQVNVQIGNINGNSEFNNGQQIGNGIVSELRRRGF
jgi:phage-related minor tail protein